MAWTARSSPVTISEHSLCICVCCPHSIIHLHCIKYPLTLFPVIVIKSAMIAPWTTETVNLVLIITNNKKFSCWEQLHQLHPGCFYNLTLLTCATLQNCGCHKHEWNQQQVPCCFHNRLHSEETWQWNRPLDREGQGRPQRQHISDSWNTFFRIALLSGFWE